jgi:hypothetical protein
MEIVVAFPSIERVALSRATQERVVAGFTDESVPFSRAGI